MVVGVASVALPVFADPLEDGGDPGAGSGGGSVNCPGGGSAASFADCAKQGVGQVDPDKDVGGPGLTETVTNIINTVIFGVGIIAVIMVILGGIQYSTSQGDPGKTKKAKDTIMYGVIGLLVAILAFTIVNFVLDSIFGLAES